jgi:NADH dehydrogenase
MPEIDPEVAGYADRVMRGRQGVEIRTSTRVKAIERGRVRLADEDIAADTIILAAGTTPDPFIAGLPVSRDARGRVEVESTMRCPARPEVWALGDCAAVPGPDGKPYPGLAQHALREARVLARNIAAVLDGRPVRPFVYRTLGVMGSLGHGRGFGQLLGIRVRGFPAWLIRRTYYLLQTPGWGRKLWIMAEWIFILFHRPDAIKVGVDGDAAALARELTLGEPAGGRQWEGASDLAPITRRLRDGSAGNTNWKHQTISRSATRPNTRRSTG